MKDMVQFMKGKGLLAFSLLLTATILFASVARPVSAESSDGFGVHADMATFEKNFSLSVSQKMYTIKKIDRMVSIVTSGMIPAH